MNKVSKQIKTQKKVKRRGFLRRAISLLFTPLLIKFSIVVSLLLAAYLAYLDATITSGFDNKQWQLPARVYARPLELYEGLLISASEFEQELTDLGYERTNSARPGSYMRQGNNFTMSTRGHRFWDGVESPLRAKVSFSGRRLSQLRQIDNRSLALLRLEPMEIGAIYPQHNEDRIMVTINQAPPMLIAILLAVEDHRFYTHRGVSPVSIIRAAIQNFKSGAIVQGGSTITQQLVKNYYLTLEQSIGRKIKEALMALLLELHYDKEAILEAYINEVYLAQSDGHAIHGFGLASQHYFNKPLKELSVDQMALLVAVIRGPNYYNPWRHPERALARRNRILDLLGKQHLLTLDDVSWVKSQPLHLGKSSQSHYAFPAYIDLVKRQLRQVYSQNDLTSNGLKIYTSFNPRIQRSVEHAVTLGVNQLADDQLQAAVIVTQPKTAEVLALIGGKKFRYSGFNRALDANRSVGSTIKPFIYLAALEQPSKYSLATLIDDKEITIEHNNSFWSPRNYDRQDHGQVPMITALAKSYNQATVRLGDQLGIETVVDTLQRSGFDRTINPVPSLFIGTTQLSPWELIGLYQTVASGGYHVPLKAIRAVLDKDNQPLERFQFELQSGFDPKAVALVTRGLVHVTEQGSARFAKKRLPQGFTVAGKTGTSGELRDSWFAGFSGDMLAVVWLGHDDNSPTQLTGASGALPIWTTLFKSASRKSLSAHQVRGLNLHWVDLKTGQPAASFCSTAIELPFIVGSEPTGEKSCSL